MYFPISSCFSPLPAPAPAAPAPAPAPAPAAPAPAAPAPFGLLDTLYADPELMACSSRRNASISFVHYEHGYDDGVRKDLATLVLSKHVDLIKFLQMFKPSPMPSLFYPYLLSKVTYSSLNFYKL